MEQLGKENAPFWYDKKNERIENNRMWLKNRVVCCHHGDHETRFITTKDLWDFFKGYGNSEQGLTAFVSGQFVWRAPNSSMTRFNFDPFTGERIDWDAIKRFYRDYLDMAKQLNNKVVISQGGVEATFKLSDKELRGLRRYSRYSKQEKENGFLERGTSATAYNSAMYAFFDHEATRAKSGRFHSLFDYHKGDFFWYLET